MTTGLLTNFNVKKGDSSQGAQPFPSIRQTRSLLSPMHLYPVHPRAPLPSGHCLSTLPVLPLPWTLPLAPTQAWSSQACLSRESALQPRLARRTLSSPCLLSNPSSLLSAMASSGTAVLQPSPYSLSICLSLPLQLQSTVPRMMLSL